MNPEPFANGLCLVCFFVAPPRLLGTRRKEPLLATGSSQDWEAALSELEKLICYAKGIFIKGEADPLLQANLGQSHCGLVV